MCRFLSVIMLVLSDLATHLLSGVSGCVMDHSQSAAYFAQSVLVLLACFALQSPQLS